MIDLNNFQQIVKGTALNIYSKSLVCLVCDGDYRKTFLTNEDWTKSSNSYINQLMKVQP
jgi:hypothetical protein